MRMESLGASRSGAQATLSIRTPRSMHPTMESTTAMAGLSPSLLMTSQEMYAPVMMMSPCAKLSGRMMPYTMV